MQSRLFFEIEAGVTFACTLCDEPVYKGTLYCRFDDLTGRAQRSHRVCFDAWQVKENKKYIYAEHQKPARKASFSREEIA